MCYLNLVYHIHNINRLLIAYVHLTHVSIDKLTRILEKMNEPYVSKINKTNKWIHNIHMNEYLPPYFSPRHLDRVFSARCKVRGEDNLDVFNENLKGFTILSTAVVEMFH